MKKLSIFYMTLLVGLSLFIFFYPNICLAILETILYLGSTIIFVLLPFILFRKESDSSVKEVVTHSKPKINTIKTTLINKKENEATYMTIYKVDHSP